MRLVLALLCLATGGRAALARDAPAAELEAGTGYAHVDQSSEAAGGRTAVRDFGTGALTLTGRAGAGPLTAAAVLDARGAAVASGRERRGEGGATGSVRVASPRSAQSLTVAGALTYDTTGQLLEPLLDQRALGGLTREEGTRSKTASAGYSGSFELDARNSLSLDLFMGGQNRGFIVRTQTAALFLNSVRSAAWTLRFGVAGLRQSVATSASASLGPEAVASVQVSPLTAVDLRAGYRSARTLGSGAATASTSDAGAGLRYEDERTAAALVFSRAVGGAAASADVDVTQTLGATLGQALSRRAHLALSAREARTERLTGSDVGAGAASRSLELTQAYGFGAPRPWKDDKFPQIIEASLAREDLTDDAHGGGRRLVARLSFTGAFF